MSLKARFSGWLSGVACALALGAQAQTPANVLVVANVNSAESVGLARAYMTARNVPERNLLLVEWDAARGAAYATREQTYELNRRIRKQAEKIGGINFVLMCANLPCSIREPLTGTPATFYGSVDSWIAGNVTKGGTQKTKKANPYFGQYNALQRFDSARYGGMLLVTRLDGWTWEDAHALIRKATEAMAQKPPPGRPYADIAPARQTYANNWLKEVEKYGGVLELTTAFKAPLEPVSGYFSWGSNDPRYSKTEWSKIRFAPGALVETFVSTSALQLRWPAPAGANVQSQIHDLLRQGATGAKGYVAEPYLSAVAQPGLLLKAYTSGYTLAEAYYYASPFIGWKDVVIGDPLCAPYRR